MSLEEVEVAAAAHADTLPSVVDIGLSSPTGIFFGYGARFPAKYRESLFLLDWAYGRIIAVTLRPKGASYTGTQETFASGRPLNVTDGCIGPEMYDGLDDATVEPQKIVIAVTTHGSAPSLRNWSVGSVVGAVVINVVEDEMMNGRLVTSP